MFVAMHVAELTYVPPGRHKKMAIVIWIAVEDNNRMVAAVGHQQLSIRILNRIILSGRAAQKTFSIGVRTPSGGRGQGRMSRLVAGHVLQSPRSPQSIDTHVKLRT
jgi:hypothetical protein